MYAFTTYVAVWLPDILVESSTGTRPSVTGLSDVTWTPAVRLVTTRELPLGCIKAKRYTAGETTGDNADYMRFPMLMSYRRLIWIKDTKKKPGTKPKVINNKMYCKYQLRVFIDTL